jgi:hypothetical protein
MTRRKSEQLANSNWQLAFVSKLDAVSSILTPLPEKLTADLRKYARIATRPELAG